MNFFLSLLFLLTFIAVICCSESSKPFTEIHRIIAVGDIHGDADNFRTVLKLFNLTREVRDKNGEINVVWDSQQLYESIPMRTSLVQMGDLIDRGQDDRRCLNLAFSLYEQVQGGMSNDKVVLLLGNHELLNLQGLYNYVNAKNFGGFVTKPLRDIAFHPNGPYGRFIIQNFKTVYVEEDTVFVHAGFSSATLDGMEKADELNDFVRKSLQIRNYNTPLLHDKGPLWTRRMIFNAMQNQCDLVDVVLSNFRAKRIIVGHTVQLDGKIGMFCSGKLLAVDVGISRWMYDNIAALEIMIYRTRCRNGRLVEKHAFYEVKKTLRRRLHSKEMDREFDTFFFCGEDSFSSDL